MAEEKSLFERLDDISTGQSVILNEITGVKSQVSDADSRILELEEEVKKLKSASTPQISQQKTTTRQLSQNEILMTFLKKAKKSWRWAGTKAEFNKKKASTIVSLIILLVVGLITSIVSTTCFQLYSTFTFFENAWMVCGIFYLVYAVKAQQIYEVNALAANSPSKYKRDDVGMLFPGKDKLVFRIFKWLAIISTICNIIGIWSGMGKSNQIAATLLEILFLGAIIFAFFMNLNFYLDYAIIWVEGHNLTTNEKVVLVLPPGQKELMLEEDFKKKLPFLYK